MQVTRKGTIFEVPGIQPKVGDQAKEFELKSLDDKVYRLADFLGKALFPTLTRGSVHCRRSASMKKQVRLMRLIL